MGKKLEQRIKDLDKILGAGEGFFIAHEKVHTYIGKIECLKLHKEHLIMHARKSFWISRDCWVCLKSKNYWECSCGSSWGYSLNNNCGDSFFSNLKNTGIPIATMQIYSVGTVMLYKNTEDFLRQIDFLGSLRHGINKGFPKLPEL